MSYQTIVEDGCVDTDGVALTDHLITTVNLVGATWGPMFGSFEIHSNGIRTVVDGANIFDATVSDCDFTCPIDIVSGSGAHFMVFRVQDTSNYWLINVTNTTTIQLCKIDAGSFSVVDAGTWVANPSIIKVSLVADSIQVRLDGSLQMSTTSSLCQTATKYGVGGSVNNERITTNVKIQADYMGGGGPPSGVPVTKLKKNFMRGFGRGFRL